MTDTERKVLAVGILAACSAVHVFFLLEVPNPGPFRVAGTGIAMFLAGVFYERLGA